VKKIVCSLAALVLCAAFAVPARSAWTSATQSVASTPDAAIIGVPWTGDAGIRRTLDEINAADLRLGGKKSGFIVDVEEREREERDRHGLPQNPDSPLVSSWPAPAAGSALAAAAPTQPVFSVGANFIGPRLDESGLIPPDSIGAVGPTQVMVLANGRLKVFDKNGNAGPLNVTTNAFFDSVRSGQFCSDPRVRFDRLTNRWFLCIITVGFPNRVLVAVSDGPEIRPASSFTFFGFQQDAVGPTPNTDTDALADYATLGVDANALYLGVNIFTENSYVGSSAFVVRKSSVLGTGPIVVTAFRNLANGNRQGIDTPQGVSNADPAATEGYFIGVDTLRLGLLNVRRVANPGGTPVLSDDIPITVPATQLPTLITPLGSSRPVDVSNDRLFAAEIFHNRATGARTLWTAHAIEVDSTGVASDSGGRTASRWYEVGDLTTMPRLLQAGTVFDANPGGSPRSFLFPSIAMTEQGHAVLGCTSAGPADRAGVAIATRLHSDDPGVARLATVVQSGSGSYNVQTQTVQRWGDYSYTTVDPVDGMTVWTFQEYCDATDSWAVRALELRAPGPANVVSVVPSSVGIGRTATVTVTGTSVNGTGFFDPDASYSSHLHASVSGTGVTVTNAQYIDPTHVALTLTAAGDAESGLRSITIVNPDGQSVTSESLLSLGPSIDAIDVKKSASGKLQLTVRGAAFGTSVTVSVDGVPFRAVPRVTGGTEILQKGKLQNGSSINRAIRRGQTVTIGVLTSSGALATMLYTRP